MDDQKTNNNSDLNKQTEVRHQQKFKQRHKYHKPQHNEKQTNIQVSKPEYFLSIIIPAYNEAESFKELYEKIKATITTLNCKYEIIIIDDGSTDNSIEVLKEIRAHDNRVKIISFRRNYGKSAALSVGFEKAKGDIIVTMDADLQDDPAEIPNLLKEIKNGKDMVSGWKKKRFDPITKTIPSKFFNFVTSKLTGIPLHDFNCGLKAYRKEVVKEMELYGELHRYIPVLARWKGFTVSEVVVQHHPRKYGKTKFGIGRFWKGFLDLLTILFTTRYLQRPLHLFGFWGLIFALVGFIIDAYLVVEWCLGLTALSQRPLFLAGVLLIIIGVQFISIGLIGEMITKTRETRKEYSIKEIIK